MENFAATPSVTWLDPQNNEVQSISSNDLMLEGPGELRFRDVNENNMGRYTCHVCVNIKEVGIVDLCKNSYVTVSSKGMIAMELLDTPDFFLFNSPL